MLSKEDLFKSAFLIAKINFQLLQLAFAPHVIHMMVTLLKLYPQPQGKGFFSPQQEQKP